MESWRMLVVAAIIAAPGGHLSAQAAQSGERPVINLITMAPSTRPDPPKLTSLRIERGPDSPVGFEVRFGPDGIPNKCTITQTSGSPETDAAACAKFISGSKAGRDSGPPRSTSVVLIEPPAGDISGIFSSEDYPPDAIRTGKQGTTVVRVAVSPDGRPARCVIAQSAGTPSLDTATCRVIMERGRFGPEASKSSDGTIERRIRWQLPKVVPVPLADTKYQVRLSFDSSGKLGPCVLVGLPPAARTKLCGEIECLGGRYVTDSKRSAGTLVMEFGVMIGGRDSAIAVGTAPGEHLINMGAQPFTVLADGRFGECAEPVGIGLSPTVIEAMCSPNTDPVFTALPAAAVDRSPRHALQYMALFVTDATFSTGER